MGVSQERDRNREALSFGDLGAACYLSMALPVVTDEGPSPLHCCSRSRSASWSLQSLPPPGKVTGMVAQGSLHPDALSPRH